MLRPPSLSISAALLVSCVSNGAPEPCGGCAEQEFCCLTVCQALGTACGGSDAGSITPDASAPDARAVDARAVDASIDPCATRAGVTQVASACGTVDATLAAAGFAGATFLACASHGTSPCARAGTSGHCVEWVDGPGVMHAVCTDGSVTPSDVCDPALEGARCEGSVQSACIATIPGNAIGEEPLGWRVHTDCRPSWSPDAVCVLDASGTTRCTSPTDVPCDPSSYVPHCDAQCMQATHAPMGGVVRPLCGGAMPMCVTSAVGVACVPAAAVVSSHAATADEIGLACVGTARRVELGGYEWTEPCPLGLSLVGGMAVEVPRHCWQTPDGSAALCIDEGATTCATETVAAHCVDATHSASCHGWIEGTRMCVGLDGSATYCDVSTGDCAFAPPCHPGWPFTETCAGADHRWVSGSCATGVAMLAPCAMCRPDPMGGVICG